MVGEKEVMMKNKYFKRELANCFERLDMTLPHIGVDVSKVYVGQYRKKGEVGMGGIKRIFGTQKRPFDEYPQGDQEEKTSNSFHEVYQVPMGQGFHLLKEESGYRIINGKDYTRKHYPMM
mmetsp:Transcript_8797/g.9737  ORF Transcript_8797/g.9737 Transcript_8797/m.9737 type:complete len:120 (-) Transcript_8797:67-426(-)